MNQIEFTNEELIVLFNTLKPAKFFSGVEEYELYGVDETDINFVTALRDLRKKKVITYDFDDNPVAGKEYRSLFDVWFNFSKVAILSRIGGEEKRVKALMKKEDLAVLEVSGGKTVLSDNDETGYETLLELIASFLSVEEHSLFMNDDDYDNFSDDHSNAAIEEFVQKGMDRRVLTALSEYLEDECERYVLTTYDMDKDSSEELNFFVAGDTAYIIKDEVIDSEDDFVFGKTVETYSAWTKKNILDMLTEFMEG